MMIRHKGIEREARNTRSSGDGRTRVDAYFVAYDCPPDVNNPMRHEWCCRFEVPVDQPFAPSNYETKAAARAAQGYKI